ncbi:hypothetical protein B0H10DRAFT_377986 [Mycena sp. CBHHK59/15]|nr:hypothetical protein B0H10DRAFT_377986 [Mycena sp. CBHHK59/15]
MLGLALAWAGDVLEVRGGGRREGVEEGGGCSKRGVTHGGRSTWCTRGRSAELFHRYSICSLSVAESRRDISASGYLLYFSGYYYHSSFVAPPAVVMYFPPPFLAVLGAHSGCPSFLSGFARSHCLFSTVIRALSFRRRCIYIHMGGSRAVRSSLGIHYPRSFVPGDLLPPLPPRSGRRVLVHLSRGSADYLCGRCRCHSPTSTTSTSPLLRPRPSTSPTRAPPPLSQLH